VRSLKIVKDIRGTDRGTPRGRCAIEIRFVAVTIGAVKMSAAKERGLRASYDID
jgi:hypothetical protein